MPVWHRTTISARQGHVLTDIVSAYTTGVVELYTVFDSIRVPGVAVFTLPPKTIQSIIVAVKDRPNFVTELKKALFRVETYIWVYCSFPVIRNMQQFDAHLSRFSRSLLIPKIHKPLFLRMGLLHDPEFSDELGFLLQLHTCTHISSDTLPFIRSVVQALRELPYELVHIILEWTWGLRLDSDELARVSY